MIELINITKEYNGDKVVDNISLSINQGEFLVLIGPSGCGKTTTMKMINRLIEPSSGTIRINGRDIKDVDPIQLRRGIGYVIQEIGLLPHFTVAENIALVPRLEKWPRAKQMERVLELLELVGLPPDLYLHKYPRELSGGQRQRVGVARAMALDPPLLLMDEPFGALDPITREQLQDEFLRLQEKVKKTIVFVTHDMDEAIKFADRIVVLNRGQVVQFDTPANILQHPANNFVRDFVGTDHTLKQLSLIKVKEVMITDITFIYLDDTIAAAQKLFDTGYSSLVVLDRQGRVEGYVNIDEVKDLSPRQAVAEAMVAEITTIGPDKNLKEALSRMIRNDAGYAAVVDEQGSLLGIITIECLHQQVGDPRVKRQETGCRVVC